jgi:hypothetical protein
MKPLKERVLEIAAIAKECPENLQQICFEVLLKHVLAPSGTPPASPATDTVSKADEAKPNPKSVVEESAKHQDDLSIGDLHVKARRFLEKNDLSMDHLNQILYKEGEDILPLYDDLKTNRTAESQVRITLLQCLLNGIKTGEFRTGVETARQEAVTRKCYDKNNWGNNYSNNATLFDFKKYTKDVQSIALSELGKSELANVIKELQ